jgi:hypothetical protein
MKKTSGVIWAVASIAALVAACEGIPVKMPTGNAGPADDTRVLTGRACGFQLLLFIPIRVNDRQQRAYAAAERQAGGRSLVDVAFQEEWTYGFVGTLYCTTVTAKAAKS